MYKLILVCIVATMMFSVNAYAIGYVSMESIGQTQGFAIYGENWASQVGGNATSSAGNMVCVDQDNDLMEFFGAKLIQDEKSMLMQGANTTGHCGSLSVLQIGGSSGSQGQLLSNMGCMDMTSQGQTLGTTLQQNVEKDGGKGTAEGLQSSLSEQSQTICGGGTIMSSSQSIGAIQTASVSGKGWSDGTAGNYADVTATQSQMSFN